MSDWRRIARGVIGMGLTFAAGVGALAAVIAGVVWVLAGFEGGPGLARIVVASTLWAFPIGGAFSGLLSLTARGRSFEELSLPRFVALGTGGGVLLFGILAANAFRAWTLPTALANLAVFVFFGAGSAAATLLIARRAARPLDAGDDPPGVGEGADASARAGRRELSPGRPE